MLCFAACVCVRMCMYERVYMTKREKCVSVLPNDVHFPKLSALLPWETRYAKYTGVVTQAENRGRDDVGTHVSQDPSAGLPWERAQPSASSEHFTGQRGDTEGDT